MTTTIEISGIFPANRGALLMFEAIRERIGAILPDARLAVPLDWPAAERLKHGAWGTPGSLDRGPWLQLLERAPWQVREATTFVPGRKVDVLLDASGFGYGDYWGTDKLRRRLADRLTRWKSDERRAVLLPQALGPFTKEGMAEAFREAAERLDRIYVRDERSMEHVAAVLRDGDRDGRVRRAPDFTNLLKPDLPGRLAHLRGAALVIPNEKMVAGGDRATFERYLDFLVSAARTIAASGRQPRLLLHEGSRDTAIAAAVNDRLRTALDVIDEPSALTTKAVIGAAELVVSSRFHGLVSALSSGVPGLACGWSHKYRELMGDYGCEDFVVDLDRPVVDRADDPVERLIAAANDAAFRDRLAARAEAERRKSLAMWDDVSDVLAGLGAKPRAAAAKSHVEREPDLAA